MAMNLLVHLPRFEGPLPLLLYLIRKEEMDIMDIKIHEITKQYLEYVKQMRELDLELAGDFVAMAATLIQIKSKMLLPNYNADGEEIESEDPRKELVQRLLEYQKFQEAARLLSERPWVGRDLFLRGFREDLITAPEDIVLEENALFSLISSYRHVLKSAKLKVHQVGHKLQSISSRVLEMASRLLPGKSVGFSDLIQVTEHRSRQILITFLSLLELAKLGYVFLFQADIYNEIWIEPKKEITQDVIGNVEEYGAAIAVSEATDFPESVSPSPLSSEDLAELEERDTVSGAGEADASDDDEQSLSALTAEPGQSVANLEAELLETDQNFEKLDELATDEEILQAELELGLRKSNDESSEEGGNEMMDA